MPGDDVRSCFGSRSGICGKRLGLGLVPLVLLGWPAAANAASNLYWPDEGTHAIMVGGLEGGAATPLISSPEYPDGVALDPATGKIYWTSDEEGEIESASLDGSDKEVLASGLDHPNGITLDAATGKIFWADDSGAIQSANLDGGDVETLYEESEAEATPVGVVVDPVSNTLYWADLEAGKIMKAPAAAGGKAEVLYTDSNGPVEVAVDDATGRIYWTESKTGKIVGAALSGTGTVEPVFVEEHGGNAYTLGIALDPQTQTLFWSDREEDRIMRGTLSTATGAKPGTLLYGEQQKPYSLAILNPPASLARPDLSDGGTVGQQLACSTGSWAADEPQAAFYRAPSTYAYQWLENGTPITGATSATFTPSEAGSYACEVTAENAAGSAAATSEASTVSAPPSEEPKVKEEPKPTPTPPAPTPSPTPTPTPTPIPAPAPAMPAPMSVGPAIVIAHVAEAVKDGKAKITLECTGTACTGTVSLAWVHGKIATLFWHAGYELAAGKRETYTAKLSHKALNRLKKSEGLLNVRVRATVKDGSTVQIFSALKIR